MLRIILGLNIKHHINMKHVRENIRMMSVNQMNVYHTILEAFNVVRNSSSEQIKMKWEKNMKTNIYLEVEPQMI